MKDKLSSLNEHDYPNVRFSHQDSFQEWYERHGKGGRLVEGSSKKLYFLESGNGEILPMIQYSQACQVNFCSPSSKTSRLSFRNGVKLTLNYKTWYLPSSVTSLQNFNTAKTIGRRAHSSQYGTETGTGTVPTTER